MALPFKLMAGGPLGSGRQWLPWIHLADEVGAIRFLLEREDARGPFNLAAPNPVTNRQLARALGRVLRRPGFVPAPGFALHAVLGEMADMLLEGQRVVPRRLLELGYAFRFPELEPALRDLLGVSRPRCPPCLRRSARGTSRGSSSAGARRWACRRRRAGAGWPSRSGWRAGWPTRPRSRPARAGSCGSPAADERGSAARASGAGRSRSARRTAGCSPSSAWTPAGRPRPAWRSPSVPRPGGCEVDVLQQGFQRLPLSSGLTVWESYRRRWRTALERLAAVVEATR